MRAVLALLTILAFAFGTTQVHDASADHLAGRGIGCQGVQVAEGARHPLESQHVEGSETRVHSPCMACLLEMQTAAAASAAPAPLPVPAGTRLRVALSSTAERHPLPRLCSSRAPPALPVR